LFNITLKKNTTVINNKLYYRGVSKKNYNLISYKKNLKQNFYMNRIINKKKIKNTYIYKKNNIFFLKQNDYKFKKNKYTTVFKTLSSSYLENINSLSKLNKNNSNFLSNFLLSSFGFYKNAGFGVDATQPNTNKLSNIEDYLKLGNFNYNLINFHLGSKRGGVGDSSHWSSGTEFLNEQFRRIFSPFNSKYIISNNGVKNNKFMYGGEFESQHTDKDFILKKNNKKRLKPDSIYNKMRFPSQNSAEFYANMMSDIDEPIDKFYDKKRKKKPDLFSYIDWGFNTDHDNINSDINFINSDPFTADIQRDPSTESVYLDIIHNEYAKELREFPEEIVDWTVSDFYTELLNNEEITDLPNSTNESELYSIDSSNSISDFYIGSDDDSNLGVKTLFISEEMSTDYNDFNIQNGDVNKKKKFNFFNDIFKIQELDSTIKPQNNVDYDFFASPNSITNSVDNKFSDYLEKSYYDSDRSLKLNGLSWSDSNKIELEDNSREIESLFRQSKYLESYRFESVLDEFLIELNIKNNLGLQLNLADALPITSINHSPSFKKILFFKTKYLKYYRGFMLDLGFENYMF